MAAKPKKRLTPSEYIKKKYHAEIFTLGEINGKRINIIASNEPIDIEDLQKRFEGEYEEHIEPIDPKDEETLAQLFVLAQYLEQQKKEKGEKA